MTKFKRGDLVKYDRGIELKVILVSGFDKADPAYYDPSFEGTVVISEDGEVGWHSEYWDPDKYSLYDLPVTLKPRAK